MQFHKDAEERIIHRLARADADYRFAVAPLYREAGSLQRRTQIDAGVLVSLPRRKSNLDVLARLQCNDFDLGVERLAQGRAYGDRSQPCCIRSGRHQKHGREHH